jgi:4-hydroxy-tetrahydrodipicolinate reductase
MGSTVCRAVIDAPGMELVAAVDPLHAGIDLGQLGVHGTNVHISAKAAALREAEVEVAVDFTVVDAARENLAWCADHGVHAVVGTTGFGEAELAGLAATFAASAANAVIAPNFAMRFDDAVRRTGPTSTASRSSAAPRPKVGRRPDRDACAADAAASKDGRR